MEREAEIPRGQPDFRPPTGQASDSGWASGGPGPGGHAREFPTDPFIIIIDPSRGWGLVPRSAQRGAHLAAASQSFGHLRDYCPPTTGFWPDFQMKWAFFGPARLWLGPARNLGDTFLLGPQNPLENQVLVFCCHSCAPHS